MKSLKTRLITFISFLLFGGLVLLAVISYSSASSILKQSLEKEAETEAVRLTEQLDVFIQQQKAVIASLAKVAAENYGDEKKQLAFVQKAKKDWPEFETVVFSHDLSGKRTITDTGQIIDVSSRSYIKSVSEGKTVIMDPVYSKVTGKVITIVASPLIKNGQVVGFIAAGIPIEAATEKVAQAKFGETGYAGLFGVTGQIIWHPKKEMIVKGNVADFKVPELISIHQELQKGKHGISFYTISGKEKLAAYAGTQDKWGIIIGAPLDELYAPIDKLRNELLIITLVVIVIGALIMYRITGTITRPIEKLNEAFSVLSSGDLTYEVHVKGKDELSQLSVHFNKTNHTLKQLIQSISTNSKQVGSSAHTFLTNISQAIQGSEQVEKTIHQVASGAESQAMSLEESTRAIQEMSSGIQRISESAANVTDSSQEAVKNAAEGQHTIKKATLQMDKISMVAQESAALVKALGERSNEISSITTAITSISAQTNLLALNAAIEAARAGEQGKGFAVVAEEVRKLAEQSGESANQISTLIQEIQNETENVVTTMNKAVEEVQVGIDVVNHVGEAFNMIVNSSEKVSGEIQEVSAATEQISAASQEVLASVEELNRISHKATDYSKEVAGVTEKQVRIIKEIENSALQLQQTSISLEQSINEFKV
ncbi:methyl-accepting chemotaxis protein [Aneurinibacillus uraniidurans]|uniref:methyl-accepting chemotaxis protein n=1 Tax=Aneurinibacillus uraniidurans TaxID=2966586 RepID=UPI002349C737|nr:methyl-accepting chemotaxis protein [Aneurinibacillus sp. B1]WCN36189.1 methyl-accepting chemotaxis protein [Aneurinibacillus sp. B1]